MFTTKNLFKIAGKHFLIALGFIFSAAVIVFFISGQITKISNGAAKDRQTAAALSERTTLLSNLKYESELIGDNDNVIRRAFIPTNNILEFVAILESLALKNGVTQSFHFSSPTPDTLGTPFPISTITYQNTISANAPTIINYLRDFEKIPYFTKIDSITISSGKADWRDVSTISFSATVAAQAIQ
ncbi:MAG: hypothetical protein M0P64_00740 [Candidatus Pacebacteria bacterium]|jgi:hypothetical protein|nr:hypothetical protein [Candidatus Paceibacterota bacterium]